MWDLIVWGWRANIGEIMKAYTKYYTSYISTTTMLFNIPANITPTPKNPNP